MNAIEALQVLKSGIEVEQLFRDPTSVREALKMDDRDQIVLFMPDFNKGCTDIMSDQMFLKSFEDAEFVVFEHYHIT